MDEGDRGDSLAESVAEANKKFQAQFKNLLVSYQNELTLLFSDQARRLVTENSQLRAECEALKRELCARGSRLAPRTNPPSPGDELKEDPGRGGETSVSGGQGSESNLTLRRSGKRFKVRFAPMVELACSEDSGSPRDSIVLDPTVSSLPLRSPSGSATLRPDAVEIIEDEDEDEDLQIVEPVRPRSAPFLQVKPESRCFPPSGEPARLNGQGQGGSRPAPLQLHGIEVISLDSASETPMSAEMPPLEGPKLSLSSRRPPGKASPQSSGSKRKTASPPAASSSCSPDPKRAKKAGGLVYASVRESAQDTQDRLLALLDNGSGPASSASLPPARSSSPARRRGLVSSASSASPVPNPVVRAPRPGQSPSPALSPVLGSPEIAHSPGDFDVSDEPLSPYRPIAPRPGLGLMGAQPPGQRVGGDRPDFEVVRNRELREQMTAVACPECERWYRAIEGVVDPEQLQGSRNPCQHAGRHRFWRPPASTPEGYWDVCSPATPSSQTPTRAEPAGGPKEPQTRPRSPCTTQPERDPDPVDREDPDPELAWFGSEGGRADEEEEEEGEEGEDPSGGGQSAPPSGRQLPLLDASQSSFVFED